MRIAILFCLVALACAKVRYDRHKVFTVHPTTDEHVETLEAMGEYAIFKADFWSNPHKDHDCDVHICPEYEEKFIQLMEDSGIQYEVKIDDIQELIDSEESENDALAYAAPYSIVGSFARTSQMDSFMKDLADRYSHATLINLGQSFEGRDTYGIKVSSGPGKKAIWIDAGIHAREWLSQSTAIWMMNEVVTKYGSDDGITAMVDYNDWYFFPNVNPDGYEYSHTSDRMWRKTRSDHSGSLWCPGADANRNFDFPKFGGAGTSSMPCSEQYKGVRAFSEVEAANIRDYVNKVKGDLKMFITLHAYSQLILVPWAYQSARPKDWREIDRVANIGANALQRVHSTKFTVGTAPALLYAASGGSFDWAKGAAGVSFSYAYELRPTQGGYNGFIVSPSTIEPSGQEVLASLSAMAGAIAIPVKQPL